MSFNQMNWRLWRAQVVAVIRLEMRKTFFAKRGIWVYLLALAPAALFFADSIGVIHDRDRRAELESTHPVTAKAIESIKTGMSRDQVEAKLGEPYAKRVFRFGGRRNPVEQAIYRYTDGENDYVFVFRDDELQDVRTSELRTIPKDSLIFATEFQFFYLRLAIFFGCVGIFTNLFRGELLDKSLHFYLLAPIRREVLLVGKYLAGLIATVVIFTTSTALQLLAIGWHLTGPAMSEYLHGPGLGQIGAYLGVTAMACLGYGSVFLAAGLLFRNPIVPAAVVLLWESANPFLPAALKKISVIFYLQSMCPVVARPGEMPALAALLLSSAEATPVVWAAGGLVVVTLAVLALAARQARKLEINYSSD
jgi:ABC-type transport system involved in multi-copper enzyme maturation permease subunit